MIRGQFLDSADRVSLCVENKVVKRNNVGFREHQIEVLHGFCHEEAIGYKEANDTTMSVSVILLEGSNGWNVVFEYLPLHLVVM